MTMEVRRQKNEAVSGGELISDFGLRISDFEEQSDGIPPCGRGFRIMGFRYVTRNLEFEI